MHIIFQYGSNCDADRLRCRLGDIRDCGRARSVREYELAFNKPSRKNNCAAADLLPSKGSGSRAWGVLYDVSNDRFQRLKDIEGPSYEPIEIDVINQAGEGVNAKTFFVKAEGRKKGLSTSADYVGHIVSGLRKHNVPEEYVQHIIAQRFEQTGKPRTAGRRSVRRLALRASELAILL
jgi:gamma-glutamylcyclotransferase